MSYFRLIPSQGPISSRTFHPSSKLFRVVQDPHHTQPTVKFIHPNTNPNALPQWFVAVPFLLIFGLSLLNNGNRNHHQAQMNDEMIANCDQRMESNNIALQKLDLIERDLQQLRRDSSRQLAALEELKQSSSLNKW